MILGLRRVPFGPRRAATTEGTQDQGTQDHDQTRGAGYPMEMARLHGGELHFDESSFEGVATTESSLALTKSNQLTCVAGVDDLDAGREGRDAD